MPVTSAFHVEPLCPEHSPALALLLHLSPLLQSQSRQPVGVDRQGGRPIAIQRRAQRRVRVLLHALQPLGVAAAQLPAERILRLLELASELAALVREALHEGAQEGARGLQRILAPLALQPRLLGLALHQALDVFEEAVRFEPRALHETTPLLSRRVLRPAVVQCALHVAVQRVHRLCAAVEVRVVRVDGQRLQGGLQVGLRALALRLQAPRLESPLGLLVG